MTPEAPTAAAATPPVEEDPPGEEAGGPVRRLIRAVFAPAVAATSRVMFWDPFAAIGLYDPTVRDDEGRPVLDAKGEPRENRIPLVVIWLVSAAAFFTLRMKMITFRGFRHAIQLIRGRYTHPDSPGQVTHFQALSTALSGTVGLGNIAGVALAVSLGGPGATFWMILAGVLGMASKFTECTLGVKYREIDDEGQVRGGPMYYLKKGLADRHLGPIPLKRVGAVLGWIWALFAVGGALGGGNMFQANQSYAIVADTFPALEGLGPYFGMALAAAVGLVIVRGIAGIGKVTGVLVPLMGVTYVGACLVVILLHIDQLDEVVGMIFAGAFNPDAAKGGFIGVMVIGLRRAAFSNEAGVGTAAIAHSTAKTTEPVAEGLVGLHEPFVDTVVICTMTALVLLFTGFYDAPEGAQGAALTSAAFGSVISWFPYVLTIAILLFSFSTLISFAYYGVTCFDYVAGDLVERLTGDRKYARWFFQVVFLLATVVGSSSSIKTVMDFADMILFGLIITNTIGLFLMSGEVAADLKSYAQRLKSGEIRPIDDGAAAAPSGGA